jgi:tRNA-dihydrouridine synthase B
MVFAGEKMGSAGIRIGKLELAGSAILAPMSGVTDIGMRKIAHRFGASLVVSEMVASDDYLAGRHEARLRAEGEGISPHVVQIAGCVPGLMAEAAKLAEASGADVIDINMGCPSKRVNGRLSGSALMRDLDHAVSLIEATVAAVKVPVTVKMRLGWDSSSQNAPELARRAEASGARMITVHGRTRVQFYTGRADWAAIRAVADAIAIPLVANGDCASLADARQMLAASGADAVMVGRAAVGRPWLVGMIAGGLRGEAIGEPSVIHRLHAAVEHLESLMTTMGAHSGLRHARKHLAAYAEFAGAASADSRRQRLVTTDDTDEAVSLLESLFLDPPTAWAA